MAKLSGTHIADRIVNELMDAEHFIGDHDLAQRLRVSRDVIEYWLKEIDNSHPNLLKIREGLGDNKYEVITMFNPEVDRDFDRLVLNGGFTRLFEEKEKSKQHDFEMKELQKANLVATTEAANESIKRSRNAEKIAKLAAAVATLALLLQLAQWLVSLTTQK